MAAALSLLEQVQGLIERTYRLDTGIREIGDFLVGDQGVRRIYDDAAASLHRARLLVREKSDGSVSVRIYYPDELVDHLERNNPLRGVHAGNVDALGDLVEELDHLLLLADRVRRGGVASLLEMELQANVTKVLVLRLLLRRHLGRPLGGAERRWVRWHILEKGFFREDDADVRRRYEAARRLALAVVDHLDGLAPAGRLSWLRAFARTPGPRRVREAARLAAA